MILKFICGHSAEPNKERDIQVFSWLKSTFIFMMCSFGPKSRNNPSKYFQQLKDNGPISRNLIHVPFSNCYCLKLEGNLNPTQFSEKYGGGNLTSAS